MIGIFDWKRALSIARKEVRHILRDPFTLGAAIGLPSILVIFFGFVIDFDVRDVRLLVFDADRSRFSRELSETFESSGYFRMEQKFPASDPVLELDAGRTQAVLVIPPEFGRDVGRGGPARAQFLLDGTDNTVAGVIAQYVSGVSASALKKWMTGPPGPSVPLRTRFLFNPELNSSWFVIPGLAAVIIGLVGVLLTALTVAREWERGSMELLLSTPVRPLEILVGKIAPYTAIGMAAILLVYASARGVFHIPFEGSHALFFGSSLVFLATALSQGLVISVVTRQQPLAMQFSIVSGLLPSMLLSGFVFPVESMTLFFRILTSILPVRWFMVIARGIFLKGAGIVELAVPLGVLTLMCLLFMAAAVKKFKTDLEP